MTALSDAGVLEIGGQQLEYRMIGPHPDRAPTIVMLHEGLGCVGMWSDFPDKLANTTGAGVFVYSRAGYGQSSGVKLPRQLIAPHFLVEDISIASIEAAKVAYAQTDLRAKLARWHKDPDNAFRGWNDAWLDPGFREWDITTELAYIRVPVLIVQGEDDQYGTVKQIEAAQQECYCPVDVALLPGAKHSPQREAPDATLKAVSDFANRLLRDHAEGVIAA
jgi:pimeloyl-ACP methyl ester carboxylesterase